MRIGTVAVVVFALGTAALVIGSALVRLGAEDLFTSVAIARGTANTEQVRTPYGRWISARLSSDIARDDLNGEYARGTQLAYRSDRLREMAAIPALIGLLAALLTGTPETAASRARSPSQPAANTTRNGTA
jgi:hypothetical protein